MRCLGFALKQYGVGSGYIGDTCVYIYMPLDGFGNVGFELLILLWFCDIKMYFQTVRIRVFSSGNLVGCESQVHSTFR